MLRLTLSNSDESIVFDSDVIDQLLALRQTNRTSAEAGGQLFARITPFETYITEATGPRPTDIRTRYSYIPDRSAERQEIQDRFGRGYMYVGDWHTHPTKVPVPSGPDRRSITECFRKSHHSLQAFLLVIVGTSADCRTWYFGLANSKDVTPAVGVEES